MIKPSIVTFLFVLAGMSSTYAQDAEKALKEYEGKVLVLRHPLHDGFQKYDAEGTVLQGGNEESWTSHGGMLIEHIELTPDKLHMEGRRTLFLFQENKLFLLELKKKDAQELPIFPTVDIDIALDHSVDSEEEGRKILGKVFALKKEDLVASVPNIWRACLTDRLIYDSSQRKEAEFGWSAATVKNKSERAAAHADSLNVSNTEPIAYVGNGVSPPKALHISEPEYSKIARYEGLEGDAVLRVVVGKDGNVQEVELVRPLGLALDESAIAMVKTWQFHPALKDKQPIAVEMNIEVNFSLHLGNK
jgi:TonB family protein